MTSENCDNPEKLAFAVYVFTLLILGEVLVDAVLVEDDELYVPSDVNVCVISLVKVYS